MDFICLPDELIEIVIQGTMPEGFESLALTCKRIFAICNPYIEHHNLLRSKFDDFNFSNGETDMSTAILSAWDLIKCVGNEPVVARYIRHADLTLDSSHLRRRAYDHDLQAHCPPSAVNLLEHSPYLKQAHIDWREYMKCIEQDLEWARYSQRATAFLLTLLPNVETLRLPYNWRPASIPDPLVNTIVSNAKQTKQSLHVKPSLGLVNKLATYAPPLSRSPLHLIGPFLALPHVRSFRGSDTEYMVTKDTFGMGYSEIELIASLKGSYQGADLGQTLETVHLDGARMDDVGIADLLKYTKQLKTLRYSHSAVLRDTEWDMARFVEAIMREAGSHLEELSVSIIDPPRFFIPKKPSLRNFDRLRKLELPLEIVECNRFYIALSEENQLSIGQLVPASVAQLSLITSGMQEHADILESLFRRFADERASMLPALEEVQLLCPEEGDDSHQMQCSKLGHELENAGVKLYQDIASSSGYLTWDGEF